MRERTTITENLNSVISGFQGRPIDLLNRGDAEGEHTYLLNSVKSYQRTLEDVVGLFPDGASIEGRAVRILEVGAYLGAVSISLSRMGFEVTAMDIPEFMGNPRLSEKYQSEGVETLTANLRDYDIPADSEAYDLVIMCETLEHLNFNPLPVLSELNRVLKDDGKMYLALPNLASLPHRVNLMLGRSIHNPIEDFRQQLSADGNMIVGLHWREYTRSELVEMARMTGFEPDRHYFDVSEQVSLPAQIVYRFVPSLRPCQVLISTKRKRGPESFSFSDATRF